MINHAALTTSFFMSSSLSASALFSWSIISKSSGRDCRLLYFSSASSSLMTKNDKKGITRHLLKQKKGQRNKLFTKPPLNWYIFFLYLCQRYCDVCFEISILEYSILIFSLSSADAPVSEHQWKKNTGVGALERENGSVGNDVFPAHFNFSLFPASPRFFPRVQSRRDCRRPLQRRELFYS